MLRVLGYGLLLALVAGLLFTACISACGVAVVSVAAEDRTFVAPIPLMIPLLATRFAPDRYFYDERYSDDRDSDDRGEHRRAHRREHPRERRWRGEWGREWRSEWRREWRDEWRGRGARDRFGARLPREAVLGLGALSGVLDSLEGVENARLVEVRDGANRVLVAVEDGDLVVRVRDSSRDGSSRDGSSREGSPSGDDGGGEETGDRVDVRVPLEALREVAEACREDRRSGAADCDPRRLAWALLRSARGSEVRVEAEDARVNITVW